MEPVSLAGRCCLQGALGLVLEEYVISAWEADGNNFHGELVGLTFPFLTYGPWAGPACALCLGGWSQYPTQHGKRQNPSLLWGLLPRPRFPSGRATVQHDLGKGPSRSSTAVGQERSFPGLKSWPRAGGANCGEPGRAQPGLGNLGKCL